MSERGRLVVKGPEKLSLEIIKDVVNSRGITAARNVLAKRHGISENRINKIWREYYGGSTLEFYKTGLKKQLPDSEEDLTQPARLKREVRVGNKKLTVEEPTVRAQATRKITAVHKKPVGPPELDIDNIDAADDTTADIVAGEINQGNDNEDLITCMYQLIESNKNLSESARTNLETARDYYEKTKRKYKKMKNVRNHIEPTTDTTDDDNTRNIEKFSSENGYDSTKVGTPASVGNDSTAEYESDEYDDRGQYMELPGDYSNQTGIIPKQQSNRPPQIDNRSQTIIRRTNGINTNNRPVSETPRDRPQPRAQPVYKLSAIPDEPESQTRSAHNSGSNRTGSKVSASQLDPSSSRFQQNNSFYDIQLSNQPRPSQPVHSQSTIGSNGNIPPLKRPI
jgi:hypothetical protein